MTHYTYILLCADDTLYIGATNNLDKRLHEHNNSKQGAHYTKIRRPVVLRYFEEFETLGESRKREAEIKRLKRQEKLELIKGGSRVLNSTKTKTTSSRKRKSGV